MKLSAGLLVTLILLGSCASIELEKKELQSYAYLELPEEKEEISFLWPVPEYEKHFFLYPALLYTEGIADSIQWPIPQIGSEHRVPVIREEPPVVEIQAPAPVVRTGNVTPPVIIPAPEPEPVPETVWEEEAQSFTPESEITLELPGTGWSYLGMEPPLDTFKMLDQFSGLQGSRFLFSSITIPGVYKLRFTKQDPRNGLEKGMLFIIEIAPSQEPSLESSFPVMDHLSVERNKEDLVKEIIEMKQRNEGPEKMIPLLESLIRLDWNNEEYAGYLFELAQQLEKNGITQDLERAFALYERIQEEFFLSSYYEKAGERILYLNRHFFLLQ